MNDDRYFDEDRLNELFSMPIGLEVEAVVDGQKFYSSQKIKDAFMKSIGSSGRSAPIYKQIESLVMKKKLLVPCYLTKNMFRFFVHKMFGRPEDKSVLGFYHMKQKRVFVLIDNTISAFGTAKNDFLASTVMHECVHLYADRMKGRFVKLFKEELSRYYISYLSRVYSLKTKPDVSDLINFISSFEYQRSEQMNKQLSAYHSLLERILKPHTTLNSGDFDQTLTDLIVIIKIYLVNFSAFVRMYRQYKHILGPLDRAYAEAFGKRNTYTTPYQELSSVSEVICVLSEMRPTHPKIKKMFKDMA
jgi:hypothetical protein